MLAPVRGSNKTEKSERTSSRGPRPARGRGQVAPQDSGHAARPGRLGRVSRAVRAWGLRRRRARHSGAPRRGRGRPRGARSAGRRGFAIWGGRLSPGQLWGRGDPGGSEGTQAMADAGLLGPVKVGTFQSG